VLYSVVSGRFSPWKAGPKKSWRNIASLTMSAVSINFVPWHLRSQTEATLIKFRQEDHERCITFAKRICPLSVVLMKLGGLTCMTLPDDAVSRRRDRECSF